VARTGSAKRLAGENQPGSSVQFGLNLTSAAPGSAQSLLLIVSDIEAAHRQLVAHGIDSSEVYHCANGTGCRFPGVDARVRGPHPEHLSYGSFVSFKDPDGNGWVLQEVTKRLAGRIDSSTTSFGSASDLESALRRAEAAHGEHEKRAGAQRDENWPKWYAEIYGGGAIRREVAHVNGNLRPRNFLRRLTGGTMSTIPPLRREPQLAGQTVVVIGGSAGIGLETARLANAEGATLVLTARNSERLKQASSGLTATTTVAFDTTDFARLAQFFDELPGPIDHLLLTGPGPYYAPLAEFDFELARRDIEAHLLLPLQIARHAANKIRPGGTLLFIGGTGGRRTAKGLVLISALTAAMPAMVKNLALELAPARVNLIAAGFVDTPLSASLLGNQLDARREQLRTTLPIRRVVSPADVAALAVHIMTNTALTGATFDIDGGQQLVEGQ
jgi:NAD(P)-dependent dehydrogenase (short-subunit alcohol dehydrogenase family)